MYLYPITRVCCTLIILVISASSSALKISVADANDSFICDAVIDSSKQTYFPKNKEVIPTLCHPLLSRMKTERIDVEINPNATQQTSVINILSSPPKYAISGFSSKFTKRTVE